MSLLDPEKGPYRHAPVDSDFTLLLHVFRKAVPPFWKKPRFLEPTVCPIPAVSTSQHLHVLTMLEVSITMATVIYKSGPRARPGGTRGLYVGAVG